MEEDCKNNALKGKEVLYLRTTNNKEAVNKAAWDGRKLNFKIKSNKDFKRFLNVIIVDNFFNSCLIVNI